MGSGEARRLVREVDDALNAFDATRAGRAIAAYVDDLSNWYVRRSRRRFWAGDTAALATLHECLRLLTLVAAPLIPFITERVWQDLFVATEGVDSVHLARWPADAVTAADAAGTDAALGEQMALVRRLVELGRAARAASKVRTRQPLRRALVTSAGWATLPDDLRAEVAAELNVLAVDLLSSQEGGSLVDYAAKANFRALGARFGADTPKVAAAVAAADAAALSAALRTKGAASVPVDGLGTVALGPDEVIVTETPRAGWAVAREGDTVALDLQITPKLERAGLAREFVRAVQDARKSSGLDVTDRVEITWHPVDPDGVTAAALREHAPSIAEEVLAVEFTEGAVDADSGDVHDVHEHGVQFHLSRSS